MWLPSSAGFNLCVNLRRVSQPVLLRCLAVSAATVTAAAGVYQHKSLLESMANNYARAMSTYTCKEAVTHMLLHAGDPCAPLYKRRSTTIKHHRPM